MSKKVKKKGFLATIWESLTKTGGCCGSGEDCCSSVKEVYDRVRKEKEQSDGRNN